MYTRQRLPNHIQDVHESEIPEGYTALRLAFNIINKKEYGTCIIDKAVNIASTMSVNYKYCKMSADSLVRTDEIKDMIQAMVDASLEWEKSHPHELSAAMAAPQLGINKRLIIIRDSMDDKANTSFTTLVDPEIIKQEGKIIEDFEGCLSVPFIYGKVILQHWK